MSLLFLGIFALLATIAGVVGAKIVAMQKRDRAQLHALRLTLVTEQAPEQTPAAGNATPESLKQMEALAAEAAAAATETRTDEVLVKPVELSLPSNMKGTLVRVLKPSGPLGYELWEYKVEPRSPESTFGEAAGQEVAVPPLKGSR